jgi:hypothetical protein
MGFVVLLAVLRQTFFLFLNVESVLFLQLTNLKVQAVDHTLKPRDIRTCCADVFLSFFNLLRPGFELLIQLVGFVHQGPLLFFKVVDPRCLSETVRLPFGKSPIVLVNSALLPLPLLLLLPNLLPQIFHFSLRTLLMSHKGGNISFGVPNCFISICDVQFKILNLVLQLCSLLLRILILLANHIDLTLETLNHSVLIL